MKKTKTLLISSLVYIIIATSTLYAYALPTEQADSIQRLLDDAIRISGTPGISVAIISDNQTQFLSSGYKSRKTGMMTDEHTLYEIGSLTKAFTAVGIFLLDERGLLSITDPVINYLPWFNVTYQGKIITDEIRIQHLIYHTSGLTSISHSRGIPQGDSTDMIRKTAEIFVGSELDFMPGELYSYGNANYTILGLIIEEITGQRYEAFMTEQVFEPLGLYNTYLYHSEAVATGEMAQGHRHAFFITLPYNAPIFGGMKPAGFIISNAEDMARWMSINLGLVQDIPEEFSRIIARAHTADTSVQRVGNTYYAAGWLKITESGILGHAGQTPSFMSNMLLFPSDKQGIIFLANGLNLNFDLAWTIKAILDDESQQTYSMSESQQIDIFFSILTVILTISAVVSLILGINNKRRYKTLITKMKIIMTTLWGILAVFTFFRFINYPNNIGLKWADIIVWGEYSTISFLFVFPLFFSAVAWHTFTKNPKK